MPERSPLSASEAAEARTARLAREAEMIAEVEAELAERQNISQVDANAWLHSLDTGRPLPFPARALCGA